MELTGDITGYIDVAQIVLYVFWLFFFTLVFWLHREGKREGYPLQADVGSAAPKEGFPAMAPNKTYLRRDGSTMTPETNRNEPPLHARRVAKAEGSPYEPEGDPMLAGVGPGSYALRENAPDKTWDGKPVLVPMRKLAEYHVDSRDPDPRGMEIVGADGVVGGRITDVWVDTPEALIRYYEFEFDGGELGPERRLVPVNFTRIPSKQGPVKVGSIMGAHFRNVPKTANPDVVTKREEDQIMGYYGGGYLYADAKRQEPLL
jgi:photosynthetic reaction center H subunit